MARIKKPYPGMGPLVLVLKYSYPEGDVWIATVGAKTDEAIRKQARLYVHYRMGETMKVVSNNPGDKPA